MTGSIAHLEIFKYSCRKASPAMLGRFVDYYGSATPLSQVSKIRS
jgi:ribosome recycling factor